MKRMFLAVLVTGLVMHLHAQTPVPKSIALINKLTATWCPPCGGWGWQAAEGLIAASEGKALFMGLYVGDNSNDNGLFKNPVSEALAPNFTTTTGLPNFGVNGVGRTAGYISDKITDIPGLKAECLRVVNEFSMATPLASPACILSIKGNVLTIDTKVQFWSDAHGDYYLAVYIIEDSAVNRQRTPDSIWTQAPHRNVLRGSMSGKPFGTLVASGTINAGQQYDTQFSFTITDPKWNKDKLQVYAVLWRKEYNDYRYVNASSSRREHQQPTSIHAVTGIRELSLFPNPAYGATTVSVTVQEPQAIGIYLTDITGRIVYQRQNYKAVNGSNAITIPLSGIMAGAYQVSVRTKNGNMTQRLLVLR